MALPIPREAPVTTQTGASVETPASEEAAWLTATLPLAWVLAQTLFSAAQVLLRALGGANPAVAAGLATTPPRQDTGAHRIAPMG